MDVARLWTSWSQVGLVLLSTASIYASVILYTKIAGLRSLATMSSFDFAATVAIGSTIATVANLATPTAHGLIVLAALYTLQVVVALARRAGADRLLDNQPLVLVAGSEVVEENLRKVRLTEEELMSQLRIRGVGRLDELQAVVMESTGSISVLTGDEPPEPRLLAGVREADRIGAATSDR